MTIASTYTTFNVLDENQNEFDHLNKISVSWFFYLVFTISEHFDSGPTNWLTYFVDVSIWDTVQSHSEWNSHVDCSLQHNIWFVCYILFEVYWHRESQSMEYGNIENPSEMLVFRRFSNASRCFQFIVYFIFYHIKSTAIEREWYTFVFLFIFQEQGNISLRQAKFIENQYGASF